MKKLVTLVLALVILAGPISALGDGVTASHDIEEWNWLQTVDLDAHIDGVPLLLWVQSFKDETLALRAVEVLLKRGAMPSRHNFIFAFMNLHTKMFSLLGRYSFYRPQSLWDMFEIEDVRVEQKAKL